MKKVLIGCGLLVTGAFTLLGLLSVIAAWEQRIPSGVQGMPRRYVTYQTYLFGSPVGDPVTYQHFFWASGPGVSLIPSSPWIGGLMAAGGLAATSLGLSMMFRRSAK